MARATRPRPKTFSGNWPDGPCSDSTAEVARLLALRLRDAMGNQSLRGTKAATGVDHTTIADVLNGDTWPDLATIARLESGLDADLWPGRPGKPKRGSVRP